MLGPKSLFLKIDTACERYPFLRGFLSLALLQAGITVKTFDISLLDQTPFVPTLWAPGEEKIIMFSASGKELGTVRPTCRVRRSPIAFTKPSTWLGEWQGGQSVRDAAKALSDPNELAYVLVLTDQWSNFGSSQSSS